MEIYSGTHTYQIIVAVLVYAVCEGKTAFIYFLRLSLFLFLSRRCSQATQRRRRRRKRKKNICCQKWAFPRQSWSDLPPNLPIALLRLCFSCPSPTLRQQVSTLSPPSSFFSLFFFFFGFPLWIPELVTCSSIMGERSKSDDFPLFSGV